MAPSDWAHGGPPVTRPGLHEPFGAPVTPPCQEANSSPMGDAAQYPRHGHGPAPMRAAGRKQASAGRTVTPMRVDTCKATRVKGVTWVGRRTVTMQDVARAAGVSRVTASYVLNANPRAAVNPETRARILQAACTLGYTMDPLARGLRGKSTFTLGHVVGRMDANQVWVDIARAVHAEARRSRYQVLLADGGGDVEQELAQVRTLLDRAVDGFVFNGPLSESPVLAAQDAGRHAVMVERYPRVPGVPGVRTDNAAASRLALAHLAEQGHRRVAYVGLRPDHPVHRERLDGARAAAARLAVEMPASWLEILPDQHLDRACAAARWLLLQSPRPTAVYAGGNLFAVAVLRVVHELGLRVPAELSIIAYDEQYAEYTCPRLTTVGMDAVRLGQAVVRSLLAMIAPGPATSGQAVPDEQRLDPVLHVRESTGPVPQGP